MVARAVSQTTTLFWPSHLSGRRFLSYEMTNRVLDPLSSTKRGNRPTIKACRTEKSGRQPTSKLMIIIMVRVMHRASS